MIQVNDHRFDASVPLPLIYSKARRIPGYTAFAKVAARRELFETTPYQPEYNPKYECVMRNIHKCVRI